MADTDRCKYCSIVGGTLWPYCLGPAAICGRVLPIKAAPEPTWVAPLTALVYACGGPSPAKATTPAPAPTPHPKRKRKPSPKARKRRKSDTRKSISISRSIFDAFKAKAEEVGLPMSVIIERETLHFLRKEAAKDGEG